MSFESIVLNINWSPIKLVSIKTSVGLLFRDNYERPKAHVLHPKTYQLMNCKEWLNFQPLQEDEKIVTQKLILLRPLIVVVNTSNEPSRSKVAFNRRNLFKRDKHVCQYCGKKFSDSHLTIEHVIPVSKGGETSWLNCVTACQPCNKKKSNKYLHDCQLNLLNHPKEPTWRQIFSEQAEKFKFLFKN